MERRGQIWAAVRRIIWYRHTTVGAARRARHFECHRRGATESIAALGPDALGSVVVLQGWATVPRRRLSERLAFLRLRDTTGASVQLKVASLASSTAESMDADVANAKRPTVRDVIDRLTSETVVSARGVLVLRAERDRRGGIDDYEVDVEHVEILNPALQGNLPFLPNQAENVNLATRARYRHVELRGKPLQHALRMRSRANMFAREYLVDQGGIDIDTPLLFKSTPEGAREFIVPTRQHGLYYALPQSPQQYKQILMAAGVPMYFQFARCFRDEDLRANRQPEFTQLDLELAFATGDDVIKLVDGLIRHLWEKLLGIPVATPIPRMTYQKAMSMYGSDKPDLRFGMKIVDIAPFVETTGGRIEILKIDQGKQLSAAKRDAVVQNVLADASEPRQQFYQIMLDKSEDRHWTSGVHALDNKIIDTAAIDKVISPIIADDLLFCHETLLPFNGSSTLMGDLRLALAKEILSKKDLDQHLEFLWVVDFPLLTMTDDGGIASTHHPFTAPRLEDMLLLDHKDTLARVRGQHYDLVLNGIEIGGGSARIHDPVLQKRILKDVLQLPAERLTQFDHLIEILGSGCPPHAGIALGFDRLMAVLLNVPSIRDVIAFPKSASGADLMVGSPSSVDVATLKQYGITLGINYIGR